MNHILIAEDDPISRKAIKAALTRGGHTVIEAADGTKALGILTGPSAPALAILDWVMPGVDGVELCHTLRRDSRSKPIYLILLTSKQGPEDIVAGLEAGADDYIVKPFDSNELRARVRVGLRIIELQDGLAGRVQELEQALIQIKQLQGLLPICSYCKKIRDDQNYWRQVEEYLSEHSDIKFSHGICPHCYSKEMIPQLKALKTGDPLRS